MGEIFWDVIPYVTLAIVVVGSWWRYRYDKYGWTTRSSQLYESRLLRIASPMFHFGLLDASIPAEVVALHREKQPSMPVYVYPADHAFNREVGRNYHAPSADLARERTLAFFSEKLK